MSSHVKVAHQEQVTRIILARADQGNRMSNEMALALAAGVDAARSSRVLVLSAAGADFCLGRDMPPPPPGSGATPLDVMRDDAQPIIALLDSIRAFPHPIVSVVRGRAWGIGMVLAAMADLTIAAFDSTFRLRELERGIPPCIAMAPLLDRLPQKAIAHLVLSAGEMNVERALAFGLVGQVSEPDMLDQDAEQLVQRVLTFPPAAVAAVKQYLATAPRFSEPSATLLGASILANVLASR